MEALRDVVAKGGWQVIPRVEVETQAGFTLEETV